MQMTNEEVKMSYDTDQGTWWSWSYSSRREMPSLEIPRCSPEKKDSILVDRTLEKFDENKFEKKSYEVSINF